MTETNAIGAVSAFEPGKTITVRSTPMTQPVKYVLGKDVRFENESGSPVQPSTVRAGTRVQLDFDAEGQVNRIEVVDPTPP